MSDLVLVADGMDEHIFNDLRKGDSSIYPKSRLEQDEVKKLLPKAKAIIIRSATKMNKEMIDLAPHLKYIIRAGEGVDNIDKEYCKSRGIKVSNTPGANSNAAAEQTIALIFALLRNIPQAHLSLHQGHWEKSIFIGMELTQKRLGLLGMGKIAQTICKRLSGFDLDIIYHDLEDKKLPYARLVSMQELFSTADILSIHMPLSSKTKGMVDKQYLSLMPSHAILVDVARGGIVNEDDLYFFLKNKKIKGAALDVFHEEPPQNSPLMELDNFICTPHLGASTLEAQKRVSHMAADQLKEFFSNNNCLNEIV